MSKAREMVREVLERDLERVKDRGPLVSTAFSDVHPRSAFQNQIRAEANEWFKGEHQRNIEAAERRLEEYSNPI